MAITNGATTDDQQRMGTNYQLFRHERPTRLSRRITVAVAKHAVWGLTKSLAAEFGPLGITANIISPGTFPGDDPASANEPKFVKLLNENPTRRLGTSDDIGAMISYLCSKMVGL